MFSPLFAIPVTLQLVAVSDGVPKLNVTPSCKGAAQAGYISTSEDRLRICIESEERTRDQLSKTWSSFPPADRAMCLSSIQGFSPTYSELATCLEMKRDLAKTKAGEADAMSGATPATAPRPRRP